MSLYGVHRFCHRLSVDAEHRASARRDLIATLRGFDLTDEERDAIAAGDVGRLWRWGVHPLLLVRLCTYGIAGLTEPTYADRIRQVSSEAE